MGRWVVWACMQHAVVVIATEYCVEVYRVAMKKRCPIHPVLENHVDSLQICYRAPLKVEAPSKWVVC